MTPLEVAIRIQVIHNIRALVRAWLLRISTDPRFWP